MVNFKSVKTVESKAYPGVQIKVRTMLEETRIMLRMRLAHLYSRIEELQSQRDELLKRIAPMLKAAEGDEAKMDAANANPDVILAARLMRQVQDLERDQLTPEYLRAMIAGIDGAVVDGQPVTEATILRVPSPLYDEMAAAVKVELGLSKAEQGNSESPSTSPAPVDGTTNSTTAGTVSAGDTGANAIAASITPAS